MPKHTVAVDRVDRRSKPSLVQVLRPLPVEPEVRVELSRPALTIVNGRLAVVREIDEG